MKILYVTTVGITMGFFKPFIRSLLDEGHSVDIATNEAESKVPDCYRQWGCTVYPISTSRSPLSKSNLSAIAQLKALVSEQGYDIVHCHTPVAAMCTRLACRKARKQGTKVFYTAHGFHFYQGAPILNWLVYYPVEKVCSYFTDVLITINQEDHALAKKRLRAKHIAYVPGVGLDLEKFSQSTVEKCAKRQELGIPNDATLLLSVGELNENKNHETVIRAIADMDVYYMIAGIGEKKEQLQALVEELNLTDRVKLLGYRTDVAELYRACDIFVFPSFREGLSVSVLEAMASGLPVVCSRIRGNTDLIDEKGGALFCPHSTEDCRSAIAKITDGANAAGYGAYNAEKIKNFAFSEVKDRLLALYHRQ